MPRIACCFGRRSGPHSIHYTLLNRHSNTMYVCVCLCTAVAYIYINMLSLNNIIFAMSTSFQMNFFIDAINRIYPSVECAVGGDCFCRLYF